MAKENTQQNTSKEQGSHNQTMEHTPHHTRAPHPDNFARLPPNLAWFDTHDNDYLYDNSKPTYQYIPKQYIEHYIQIKTTILHHLAGPEADDVNSTHTER
eukprot:253636-Prorocentrum_lima.AAC.1